MRMMVLTGFWLFPGLAMLGVGLGMGDTPATLLGAGAALGGGWCTFIAWCLAQGEVPR